MTDNKSGDECGLRMMMQGLAESGPKWELTISGGKQAKQILKSCECPLSYKLKSAEDRLDSLLKDLEALSVKELEPSRFGNEMPSDDMKYGAAYIQEEIESIIAKHKA